MNLKKSSVSLLAFGSLGVVFGDIGTSPIYTINTCLQASTDAGHVRGAVSLVIAYLVAIVSIKYVYFLMKLSNQGEGGVFALLALVKSRAETNRRWLIYTLIGGAALLYGDGIITPAISVLSAVEGEAPPSIPDPHNPSAIINNPAAWLNPEITAVILVVLFGFQRFGTDLISKAFAPIMSIWFVTIGVLGIYQISLNPVILWAINPLVGLSFVWNHPSEAMTMLAYVTLAITGAEALYADMGHFGKQSISMAWYYFVAPTLILNYLGQGALALKHPEDAPTLFFSMAPPSMLWPLTLLSVAATIIASQALISAAFSLTKQAVNLGYCPRRTIRHTSATHYGQIYLPAVNLLLAIGSISLVLIFKRSDNLADAFGLAVAGTMLTTTIAYAAIKRAETKRIPVIALFLVLIDLSLLIPNTSKFMTGGYIPVTIGVISGVLLLSWNATRTRIRDKLASQVVPIASLPEMTRNLTRVRNTVIALSATPKIVPVTILNWLKIGQVIHEQVVVLTLVVTADPYVDNDKRLTSFEVGGNIYGAEARFGFMEEPNLSQLEAPLRAMVNIPATRQLYYLIGRENLIISRKTDFPAYLYRLMAGTSRPVGEYLHIPPGQTIEIGTSINI